MQLSIKPSHFNSHPLSGLLLPGASVHEWLAQIAALQIPLNQMDVFPIPGNAANTVWGCFISTKNNYNTDNIGKGMKCQLIHGRLYIPQYASVFPQIGISEMEKIFRFSKCILHPEFGLVALDTPMNWQAVFEEILPTPMPISKPADTAMVPFALHKMEVKALPPEDVLNAMEQDLFPQQQSLKDKPLSMIEKIKYNILKGLFSGASSNNGSASGTERQLPKWMETLGNWMDKIMPKENKWMNKLQQNLEDLEKRNQSEMDKLMEMFKNNPEEALKYAIPLDESGTNRGGNQAAFELAKRWSIFSWASSSSSSGNGNVTFTPDAYQRLREQYTKTVQELIRQKEYEKAAFVYMKLLKNSFMAAQTLEEGSLFPEAAAIFLKHVQNKERAAQCYEKGSMTTEAIGLYKELNQHEKAGDLYLTIRNQPEAFKQYNIVLDEHKEKDRYVKASLLYRTKMGDTRSAQDLLMTGWRQGKDAFNCLNNYFDNIEDEKHLAQAIDQVYLNDTDDKNSGLFLKALKHEHKKHIALQGQTQEIAYEIVSKTAQTNPAVVNELTAFNIDKSLNKDISRFKAVQK